MRPERARNMAAKILRKPARSIVSVDIEQLLMPFRAAKQPVWHCNMARLAGLYGPFGIAGPRPLATRCMPARWPMRPQPRPPQPKRRLWGLPRRRGRAYVWLSAVRAGLAVPSARVCPRGRPEFSWGCRRRFPRWPWRRGHQAASGHGTVVTRPGGRLRLVSSSPRRWCNGAGRGCAVRKTPFVCGFSRHFF